MKLRIVLLLILPVLLLAPARPGVPILAGTDTGNPFCFPGFSLHEELALLVIAGLTPVEALRSATLNPAKFFGLDQTLGTIEQESRGTKQSE
jgi:imidazolonepropionase-like amidohydrolase